MANPAQLPSADYSPPVYRSSTMKGNGSTLRSVMFLARDYLGMERVVCLPEAKLSEEGTSRDSLLVKEAATERDTKISFTH